MIPNTLTDLVHLITTYAPERLLFLRIQLKVFLGSGDRRKRLQLQVGVGVNELKRVFERVGGQSVAAIVGHVSHEDVHLGNGTR